MKRMTRTPLLVATAFTAAIGLAACGGGSEGETTAGATSEAPAMSSSAPAMDDSGMVGAGCADYAKAVPDGDGSVEGMAQDPVATAASNNPLLTTLTKAVSGQLNKKVDLVDTLNGGEFTVFAPVDDAFAKIPEKDLNAVVGNAKTLTSVLTYHVVAGQKAPDAVVGEQTTVEGQKVEVTGSGDNLKVNDANVICGGVKTANATVYLIDSVLMPPKM